MSKKSIFMILSLVLCVSMAISGTLAYLTDTDYVENTMTLGNVEIEQIEKELDGGVEVDFTQDKLLIPAVIDGDTIHNAVDKRIYVKNTGNNNAYIQTVIGFEMGTVTDETEFAELIGFEYNKEWMLVGAGVATRADGSKYYAVTLRYNKIVEPGETTPVSLQQVYLAPEADSDDIAAISGGDTYSILAVSQAVQADGFASAEAALKAAFADSNPFGEIEGDAPTTLTVVEVSTAAQLFEISEKVNGQEDDYADKLIKLTANIDLENKAWQPIGQTGAKQFRGVFDGNGFTISNLNVDMTNTSGDYVAAGLFGWVENHSGGVIKNVKIDGATVKGNHYVGAVAGYLGGKVELNNCSVTNVKIECTNDKAGGVVGFINSTNAVTNCSVSDSTVTAGRDAGQVIGCAYTTCSISGNTATNVTVSANGNDTGANINNKIVGRYADAKDVYMIGTADELFAFAKEVNNDGKNFAGVTVKLTADINLQNKAWTPIGQTGATEFKGVFDGNGHTIYNLTINNTDTSANCATGLFGWIESHDTEGVTVKNLTIDGATISGHHNVAAIAGYVYGTIENCVVKNATISATSANNDANGDKVGTIAGYVGPDAGTTISNCSVSDSTVSAGRDAGQVVGAASQSCVTGCAARNVTVTANGTSTGANIRDEVIGRVL